jgi:hypothetical protein
VAFSRLAAWRRLSHQTDSSIPSWSGACGGPWTIPPGATSDYFLSATLTPQTNHPSALNYNLWQGTLQLPKVKIPADKTKQNP